MAIPLAIVVGYDYDVAGLWSSGGALDYRSYGRRFDPGRTLDKNLAGSNPGTRSSDLSSPPSGWIDVDHVMEQQWRNGLGRPDRLCGRRFDPERTFFTNQDKIIVSAPGFESHAFCGRPHWIGGFTLQPGVRFPDGECTS